MIRHRLFALIAAALTLCAQPALAQSTSNATAVQGVVSGYGDPVQVAGNAASQATATQNPVVVGCVYRMAPSTLTDGKQDYLACDNRQNLKVTVLTGNGSTLLADNNGLSTQPAPSATFWGYAAVTGGIVSSTADVAAKAAAGAGVRNYVCTLDVSHDLLSAVSEIVIKDGATVTWRGKLQVTAVDAGGGAGKMIFTPCLKGTANTAVNVAMITSVTGGVYVNLTGYTGT